MKKFETIEINVSKKLGKLVLNRPEKHNAMNALMISEIRQAIDYLGEEKNVKVVLILSNGKSFSSGADLNYMREQANMSLKENIEDSRSLAKMFYEIFTCPKPVITYSHGTIAGGANGIVAASDFALTEENSTFRFSEVHLGLVPATISPYIIDRIGRGRAMELLLSGRKFSGKEAEMYNLVNKSVNYQEMQNELDGMITAFLKSAPEATRKTKELILKLSDLESFKRLSDETANIIAQARASKEGKEGINSFFEKRKPGWIDEKV